MKIHENIDCTDAYKSAWLKHQKSGNKAECFIETCEIFAGQKIEPNHMENIMASITQADPRMKINKHGKFFGTRKIKENGGQ